MFGFKLEVLPVLTRHEPTEDTLKAMFLFPFKDVATQKCYLQTGCSVGIWSQITYEKPEFPKTLPNYTPFLGEIGQVSSL